MAPGMYVRNKEYAWLRLPLLRRQSDHTEGEVPVDRCQLQIGVHTAPSHWYSLLPGLSRCSVLHWELRIEWQQGMYVRNKEYAWLRLPLLRRQSDHTEGEDPVDRFQLQIGVHTAPSHWYSLLPGLSRCSVLHWELRIEWQQGVYVRNKEYAWLRLPLLRRQSDHTEGEVPVDRCQLQIGVHTAPSHWYSLLPGLSCCSVLHWELRIEWQQGVYVRNKEYAWLRLPLLRRQSDHTEGEVPVSFSVTGWCSHGSFSLVL